MQTSKLPYILLLSSLLLLNGLIFLTPFVAMQDYEAGELLHKAFSPTCHQLTSRSLCLFRFSDGRLSIGDCMQSDLLSPSRATVVQAGEGVGYKLPVCSRDVAIYFAMLLGTIALPFLQKIESQDWPDKKILIAAAVPIAIDGATQLLGLRESSNSLRLITGFIIGIVLPFYLLPILNAAFFSIFKKKAGK
jgi:uncharacterized membrane protein